MHVENLVLGAGPAGLQLAYFLRKQGLPYLVLDRSDHPGASFDRHPRHRKLLSINKRYTGYPDLESQMRYDWNSLVGDPDGPRFVDYTGDYFPDASHLTDYLADYAKYYDLQVRYGSTVVRVERDADRFALKLADGTRVTCDQLFVGTGVSVENVPQIEGLSLCDTYDTVSVNPEDFTDKRVMIVGKGNSAFETAENLVGTSRKLWVCGPRTVRLAWATHYVGDLRAVNNNFLDTYQLKAQNNILDGALSRVSRDEATGDLVAEVYFESRKRSYEYACDHVILCTGFRFDESIYADECHPKMRQCGRLPLMTCEWESVNVPGMFFIGTLMQSRDYRKTMSGFIHGFRHNIEALAHMLRCRRGQPWAARESLPRKPSTLAQTLIERLSTSAPLLLQPGFLCDAIGIDEGEGPAVHYRDVPFDYVQERILPRHSRLYVASLEYAKQDQVIDPFAMPRGVGVKEDFYIHPIVRRYDEGSLVGRVFLPDDLDNDWRLEAEHLAALEKYFQDDLGPEVSQDVRQSFFSEVGETTTGAEEEREAG